MPPKVHAPKRGPTRKSRRKRLSSYAGSYGDEYQPSEEQWAAIGAACGRQLSEDDRKEIAEIAQKYLQKADFERNAPFLDDAQEFLGNVEAATEQLRMALTGQRGDAKQQAGYAGLGLLERHLQSPYLPERNRAGALVKVLDALFSACVMSQKELPTHAVGGFEEGHAWNQMIRELTAFAEQRGLPTGASKGSGKLLHASPSSPFVAFVRAFQNTLPVTDRRHLTSDDALAAAIALARRKRGAREINAPQDAN